jgi:hypothetical protein
MQKGAHLCISAQNRGSRGGDITVRILIDGVEFKRSDAFGAHTIASASGRCCQIGQVLPAP